jgi:hypothetical protein
MKKQEVRTMSKTTRDTNEAAAPARRPTILRRLVETVASEAGAPSIRLTPEGNAVLRGLGIR